MARNADEVNDGTASTTVRAFEFDGSDRKWRVWEVKTLALARSKGFLLALTVEEEKGSVITTEEFEAGGTTSAKVAEGSGSVDDEPEDVFTELTMRQKNKYLAQSAAWTYLVASYTGKAFGPIERHTGDHFKAWGVLQE